MNRRSFISAVTLAGMATTRGFGGLSNVRESDSHTKPAPELEDLISRAINDALYVRGVMELESAPITELHLGGTIPFKLPIIRADTLTLTTARRIASEIAASDARIQLVNAGKLSDDLGDRVFCSYEHKKHIIAEVEIDPQPLRYNDWPEFIEPEATITGPASRVNPDWVRAKNEVAIGVHGTPFLRRTHVQCVEVIKDHDSYYSCRITREWVRLGGRIGIQRIKRPTSWMALDYGPPTVRFYD